MIRTLTFTTLYPNETMPRHGIFVENRLRQLLATNEVETRVLAPVPWFPFRHKRFGSYAAFARVPSHERRHGIEIDHPRYPILPKVGMYFAPWFMASAMRSLTAKMIRNGRDFDLIDAHYFYPDGVAAVLLGQWLNKPVVITARGSDVNLIPQFEIPRRWISWAARRCARIITVSEALAIELRKLGINSTKVNTLRNGVDLAFFHPINNRDAVRDKNGLDRPTLLSVGNLIESKGHHIAIDSLRRLPEFKLLIAGDGDWRAKLQEQVMRLGLGERVRFLGTISQMQLREFYNAADALVLVSSREGMANVLLESLACGTPLVSTAVGGTPEVIAHKNAGVLMQERSVSGLVDAVRELFSSLPTRSDVRAYAERFNWRPTTEGQLSIFREALGL